MQVQDVDIRVKRLLTQRLGMPDDSLDLGAKLVDDLGMDSLDSVELALAVEREFGVPVREDDFVDLRTVGDVITMVEGLTQAQPT